MKETDSLKRDGEPRLVQQLFYFYQNIITVMLPSTLQQQINMAVGGLEDCAVYLC